VLLYYTFRGWYQSQFTFLITTARQKTMRNLKHTLCALLASIAFTTGAVAGQSPEHLSAASKHVGYASEHLGTAAVKGTSASMAVPLIVVGSAGIASTAAGESLLEIANQPLPLGYPVAYGTPTPAKALDLEKQQ
jgi:hypothetical protein